MKEINGIFYPKDWNQQIPSAGLVTRVDYGIIFSGTF